MLGAGRGAGRAGALDVTFAIVPADTGSRGRGRHADADRPRHTARPRWARSSTAASLQRTRAATEAIHLLARYLFDDLGYRRFEWKLDCLNAPSARAARRLGFTYEGRFRNAMVYKGRNRDTDWFAMTDADWPRDPRRPTTLARPGQLRRRRRPAHVPELTVSGCERAVRPARPPRRVAG